MELVEFRRIGNDKSPSVDLSGVNGLLAPDVGCVQKVSSEISDGIAGSIDCRAFMVCRFCHLPPVKTNHRKN